MEWSVKKSLVPMVAKLLKELKVEVVVVWREKGSERGEMSESFCRYPSF